MKTISLDPRMNRIDLPAEDHHTVIESNEAWPTWEVFHQKKKGTQHSHVGVVHAPNAEMAMNLAKEQFSRRGPTTNLWVVPSSEVFAMDNTDSDVFDTTPEKIHREAAAYKLRDKIEKYKEENPQ